MHPLANNPFLNFSFGQPFDKMVDNWFSKAAIDQLQFTPDEGADTASVSVDLPGVKGDDLDISVDGDRLTIKAERKSKFRENTFMGTVSLPKGYDRDNLQATMEDGVLTLVLPKLTKGVEPPKKIRVGKTDSK